MVKDNISESKAVSSSNKIKIFIVDNHPIVRQGLSQLIKQEIDLTLCGEAGDISGVLSTIKTCIPDIVIIEISLGTFSGLKLIEDLCHEHPDIRVLILSIHDEVLYAERCLKAGAKGYIMKNEEPEQLLLAIRTVINGDTYISAKLAPKLIKKLVSKSTGVNSSTIEQLSNREFEVFQFIGQGMKTRDIAETLNLSIKTIETYIAHIKKKMDFKSSRELFLYAAQLSIIEKDF
jgi:DNA-binding NarL/FixJ family response regulator